MGTKKGNNSGGTRRGGAGGATATPEMRIALNTGAPGESPPAAEGPAARQVSAGAALSVTPSG